jgi:TP901 family phage tail tape measure protein
MSDQARATIEITANPTKLSRGLATASSMLKGFAAHAARGVSSAFSHVGGVAKGSLSHLGGNLLTKGVEALSEAAQGVREFERNLMRFQITTSGNAATTAALRAQIRGVSKDTAIASDEILAGASQYVALTGDAEGAQTAMASFARIAQASGASVADVASATASLKTSMGLNAKDIEAAFSGMIVQGKAGAVEIKDMAGELATLAPQFAQFRGGQGLSGIREMGSAFQVIRTGAGTAGEAATQFQSLMGAFADTEVIRKLKLLKINLFDKDPQTGLTTMRSASDIFKDLADNQKLSDPRIVAAIFGRKEAQSAVRSIRNHISLYNDLREAAKDTGAVQRDMNDYLESDAGKIDRAYNNVKVTLANVFTPERIAAFSSALSNAVDLFSDLVRYAEQAAEVVERAINYSKYGRFETMKTLVDERAAEYTGSSKQTASIMSGGREQKDFSSPAWKYQFTRQEVLRRDAAQWRASAATATDELQKRSMLKAAEDLEKAAARVEARADVWVNKGFVSTLGPSTIVDADPKMQAKLRAIDDRVAVDQLQRALTQAIADGFVAAGKTARVDVEIGRDKIVEGNRSSAKHRTRTAP